MNYSFKRLAYERMPGIIKKLVCQIPFGYIAGGSYRTVFKRNAEFDNAGRVDILNYQRTALGEMLRFATEQVPAYRHLKEAVARYDPLDALKEFPLLDKTVLQQDIENYLPRDFNDIPHYECTTGGTSGNQLRFFVDDDSQSVETAFMHRQWLRVGYTPKKKKATFRGVPFSGLKPGIYWQENPIYNEMQFSPFHMNETTLHAYIERMIRYRPDYLHGYPSAINILAEFVIRHGFQKRLPGIAAVLVGSEGCLPGQRERIERAFNTRMFSWYGHSERVVLAGECETTNNYHQFPDYGILEMISEDGAECEEEGDQGEIIGTGLLNRSLPLIRYRTGDYATRLTSHCSCGRRWDTFKDVKGRWSQDMVIGKHGTEISIAALNMHGSMFENVIRYQYEQTRVGSCYINLMVNPSFREEELSEIRRAYQEKVGDQFEIMVRIVDDIPLTDRGKHKYLLSRLPENSQSD